MSLSRWIPAFLVCLCIQSIGDVVTLDNGSRIVGEVQVLTAETVTVKTDFAGVLVLKRARVTSVETDAPRFVALKSGNRLFGTVSQKDGQTVVSTPDGVMTVNEESLVAIWDKTAADPTVPPPPASRKWSYELGADLVGKAGNTEKYRLGAGASALLKGPEDALLFYLRGAKAEEEGKRTESEIIGGIDFERIFWSKRHLWYVRTEMEQDDTEDVDLRTTAAAGYGYYFLQGDKQNLRARGGLLYRHESYNDGRESKGSLGLDLGLHHDLTVNGHFKINNDIVYMPAFENFSDYRIYHESSLEVPLGGGKAWKLRLGMSNEYNSLSAHDKKDLDTMYFARLVLSFD
ncbi:MAG: DUF481 domain-containing protein [Lentisphaeria bacterium]|nr:DUF481 domain-containing protein [Lentisphaeria bacterium]